MMRRLSLTVAFLLIAVGITFSPHAVRAADETCYWPNKDPAPAYKPCGNSSTSARSCCNNGEPCLSNGLCFSPAIGVVYRGACSDSTWPEPACPNLFFTKHENATANMLNCENTPKFRDVRGQCSDSDVYPWIGAKIIPYQGAPSSPNTVSATSNVSATASQSTVPPASQCPNPGTSRMAIGLGVGLGVGLPLLAIAATFSLLWLSERKRRMESVQVPVVHELPKNMSQGVYNGPLLHEIDNTPKSPGELDGEGDRLFGFGRRK